MSATSEFLTRDRESDLFKRFREGDRQSGEVIALAFSPLVCSIVHIVHRRCRSCVAKGDLIAAGYEGLMTALSRFDPSQGHRFGSYAKWWVGGAIRECYRRERWWLPSIPRDVHHDLTTVVRCQGQLRQELFREPTEIEIAERLGMPVSRVRKLLAWLSIDSVLSLSLPVGDADSCLADLIPDSKAWSPSESNENSSLRDTVAQVLKSLTPREEKIIRMRFGLDHSDAENTLNEIGQTFDVGPERIRRIEAAALRKLRLPSRLDRLRSFARHAYD